jgi:hypothetical protein
MLLAVVVWLGGLIFFAFVVAPAAFAVLPTRHLAGNMVGRTLGVLHWMGIFSGAIFLVSSILYSQLTRGLPHLFALRNVLVILMLVLTLVSQFGIIPRMDTLRASIGEIDSVPPDNPARMQFDALHVWSTRLEGGVLILGLVLTYLTASAFAS